VLLFYVWLGGAGAFFAIALVRVLRFEAALRKATCPDTALQSRANLLAERIGLKRTPPIQLVPGRLSPMLWGIGWAGLIIPADRRQRLDADRRDALLLHELAHFKRGDHWVRWLELAAGTLFWWHPVVWLARTQLREAEEQCCDAWVVWTLPEARRVYASALMDTVDFLSEGRSVLPALASGIGRVRHLRRRLTMIMRGNTPRRLPRLALTGLMAGGLAFGTLGTSWGDDRPGQPKDEPPTERRGERERRVEEERRVEPEPNEPDPPLP